jgi:hypothetical protein
MAPSAGSAFAHSYKSSLGGRGRTAGAGRTSDAVARGEPCVLEKRTAGAGDGGVGLRMGRVKVGHSGLSSWSGKVA